MLAAWCARCSRRGVAILASVRGRSRIIRKTSLPSMRHKPVRGTL